MAKGIAALKPRKQPLQRRSAQTVEDILEAAARILERDGLGAFTTNRVAERAGISIGSLYQYFPNKQALLAALIERAQQRLRDDLARAMAQSRNRDLKGAIALVLRAAIADQIARPTLAAALDFDERCLPVQHLVGESLRFIRTEIVALLGRYRGELAVRDLGQAATDIQVIARALIEEAASGPGFDAAAVQTRALRAVLGYLTVKP